MFLHARDDSCIIPQPLLCLSGRDFLYASVIYQTGIWYVVPVLAWLGLNCLRSYPICILQLVDICKVLFQPSYCSADLQYNAERKACPFAVCMLCVIIQMAISSSTGGNENAHYPPQPGFELNSSVYNQSSILIKAIGIIYFPVQKLKPMLKYL